MKPAEHSFSAKYLMLILTLSIFTGEMVIMLAIDKLLPFSEWEEALFDAALLSLFTFPILYFMAFRPLQNEISKNYHIRQELFEANNELQKRNEEQEEKNNQLQNLNTKLVKANEKRYNDLFNSSTIGSLVLSDSMTITDVDFVGEYILGIDKSKILNRNIESFFPEEKIENWREAYSKLMLKSGANKQSCKLIIRRDDGSEFDAFLSFRFDDLAYSKIRVLFKDIKQP